MKRFVLLAAVVLMAGCSIVPKENHSYAPPVSTAFSASVQVLAPPTTTVKSLPALPQAKKVVGKDGKTYAAFTPQNFNKLLTWTDKAKKNTKIAKHLSKTVDDVIDERNFVRSLGMIEQERANYLAHRWADSQRALQDSEKLNVWNNVWHSIMIMGIILILH